MAKRAAAALSRAVRAAEFEAVSDRDLLGRYARAGDQAAFAAVVGRHAGMVHGVCRRALPSPADAEDACQAVFLVLAQKAGAVRWQSSAAGWLYDAARKVSRSARTKAARRAKREGRAAVPEAVTPADRMTARELTAVLDEELDRLPPRYRAPLVLCHLEGLTRDEAAVRLGVPVATLKSQLERGRKRLADALTARGCGLGVALLVTAAVDAVAAGPCPPALLESILAAAGGAPSATAAALAKGITVNGLVTRTKLAVLAAAGMALTGVGFGTLPPIAAEPPKPAMPARAAAKADPPAAAGKGDPAPAKSAAVTGRVVGPDGKPVAGARLFHPTSKVSEPTTEADIVNAEVGRTDADGRFRVDLTTFVPRVYLIATHPGFGVDWIEFDKAADLTKPVELRLPADLPIAGRVMNSEGKPVPGVSVRVAGVYVPKDDDLNAYLAGWLTNLRDAMSSPTKRVYAASEVIAAAVTDADGRYTLPGAGAGRIVHVVFEGGGIARSNPIVITRPGFDPAPYNAVLLKKEHDNLRVLNRFLGLLGPDSTFVAEPGRVVEGVVTAGGKPVAGCTVDTRTGWGDGVSARTGADGRYRLEGVPKQKSGYSVSVRPPKGGTLQAASANAPETEGVGPVRADVVLATGVVVTGRVVDKQTGKGVSAGVRLAPLQGNKFYNTGPGTDAYRHDRTMSGTDADGRFRLLTIPGPALLMVQVHGGETFHGEHVNPYRNAVPDPAHKDVFKHDPDDDSWTVTTVDNSIEFLDVENTVKVIDVKERGETVVDLSVDRGMTGRVEVRGPDGKPLAGAHVAGMTAHWPITYKLPGETAPLYALDPAKPRTVAAMHPGKKLAGVVTVRGDEPGPVVLTLAPVGTVTGRLTEDGVPLGGAEITANAQKEAFRELYRFTATDRPKPAVTDADGRFTLPDVIPGMPFYLQIRKGEQYYGGKPKVGLLDLKSGETKALGDRAVEHLR